MEEILHNQLNLSDIEEYPEIEREKEKNANFKRQSTQNTKGLNKIEGFFVKSGKPNKIETSSANFNYDTSNLISEDESDVYHSFKSPQNNSPFPKKYSEIIASQQTNPKKTESGATNIKIKMTIENETNKEKLVIKAILDPIKTL